MSEPQARLVRSLRLSDAIIIGTGSMVGAGVYSVWSGAARSSGSLVLVGLAIAALVAFLNALSTARLARIHPESGGTYIYGRERLGSTWGFVAGWGFVVGKTASCAAMASTIGAYVVPDHPRLTAITVIVVMTMVNIGGLQRTVRVTKVLLAVSITLLLCVIVSGVGGSSFEPGNLWPLTDADPAESTVSRAYGVLQSAGLLFFAFAGYARVATLGEEVREPERTIPRAIVISLSLVLILYATIGFVLLSTVTPVDIAATNDPLRLLVASTSVDQLVPLVRLGAVIAALGALLNLLPGVSRTALAMARQRDLPPFFAHVDTQRSLPVRAELAVAACAITIIALFDLRNSIALSGVGVLLYYSITHLSSLTLPSTLGQRLAASVGVIGCLVLVLCLPLSVLATGSAVVVTGVVAREMWHRRRGS